MADTTLRFVFEDDSVSAGLETPRSQESSQQQQEPTAVAPGQAASGQAQKFSGGGAGDGSDVLKRGIEHLVRGGRASDFFVEEFQKAKGMLQDEAMEWLGKRMRPGGAAAGAATEAAAGAGAATEAAAGAATEAAAGAGAATEAAAGAGAAGAAGGAAGAAGGGAMAALGGPVGLAVVAAIGGSIVATKALTEANERLRRNMEEVSERLRPYSASLQVSDARIEVAKMKQDIEQARNLGDRLGKFNESQARIDRAMSRLSEAVTGPLLDAVTPLVELAANIAEPVSQGVKMLSDGLAALNLLKPPVTFIAEGINRLVGNSEEERNKLPPEADILGAFSKEKMLTVNWNGRVWGADDVEFEHGGFAGGGRNGTPEELLP